MQYRRAFVPPGRFSFATARRSAFSHSVKTRIEKGTDFYFHTFSPLVGGLISGDRPAYEYLPRSVDHFEEVEDIAVLMSRAGLTAVEVHRLMFGVAVVHVGVVA